jgi:8-amino-7-oxononanoate synthase
MLGLQDRVLHVLTFENGLGCLGAAILGSLVEDCLVCPKLLVYQGLSLRSVAAILTGYQHLEKEQQTIAQLRKKSFISIRKRTCWD